MEREEKVHELKCRPDLFDAMWDDKNYTEIRLDQDFREGDILLLRECSPDGRLFLGREMVAHVMHVQPVLRSSNVVALSVVVTDRVVSNEIEYMLRHHGELLPV
jgi:hypothetical protein